MKIAIDSMGGDNAPNSIVEGALLAAKEWPDTDIILVGDEAKIAPLAAERLPNIRIVHADEVITADDEPVKAVRRKKNASMVVAGRLVKEKEADAMLSAGNTGALMATGLLVIGRINGVERPALAQMLPTINKQGVLVLDLGANMDAQPEHLLQYALMGHVYGRQIGGLDKPRIGLLNVGTEEAKGNELSKAVFPLLKEAPIHFIGNVEARDVLEGRCNVLVCDGFAGNIMLKAFEGASGMIFSALKREFTSSLVKKLAAAVLAPGLRGFRKQMDYREYGGAPLFGLGGICIKGHGSSDALAVMNAVRQARVFIQNNLAEAFSAQINGK